MNLKKTSIKLIPIIKLLCLVLCLTHTSEATRCPSKQNSPMANAGKKIYRVAVPCLALLRGDIVGAVSSALLIHGFYTTNTLLENRIGKKRPCGCDGAFPSGHTIVMGTGSSYLMFRYGWRFGLPPMILAFILLSDRVASDAHSWEDIIGTAILYHFLTGLFVTRRGRRWRDKWTFFKKLFSTHPHPA